MRKVIQVTDKSASSSALQARIAEGKADPITDEERAIVKQMRANFNKRYGRSVAHQKSARLRRTA